MLKDNDLTRITLMHTNDMHSNIDPFPANHKRYPNMGGFSRRFSLVKGIRTNSPHNLLLDAGDIFQGTPYFNFYGGEVEFKLMSELGYDCATMGNHDFDNGIDGFNKMLPKANFPFVTSNYDFSNTILNKKTKPFSTFQRGPIKIGVFGIGIELDGLVGKDLYKQTIHLPAIETANKTALHLKEEEKCDLVICLSHLGYKYDDNRLSDHDLAKASKNIDVIIGGHTHTFLEKPVSLLNSDNNPVIVNQVGWAGLKLGVIDIVFDKNTGKKLDNKTSSLISKNYAKNIC